MKNKLNSILRHFLLIFGGVFLAILIIAPLLRDIAKVSTFLVPQHTQQDSDSANNAPHSLSISEALEKGAMAYDAIFENLLHKIASHYANNQIYSHHFSQTLQDFIRSIWNLKSPQELQDILQTLEIKALFDEEIINILSFNADNLYGHIHSLMSASMSATSASALDSTSKSALDSAQLQAQTQIQEMLAHDIAQNLTQSLYRNYSIISQATYDTIYMVAIAIIFAVFFGLPLGIALSITKKGKIISAPWFNVVLGWSVNIVRSFPFIILIILLLPLSRLIVGTMIGPTAAIVPLGIAAIPFIARLFEGAFEEVDKGLIEATTSMGATKFEIIKMMIAESMPGITNAIIITIIGLIGHSAMAGAVGAGGLGDVAIRLGFQSYESDILLSSVIVIIVLVQWVQSIGDRLVANLRKNR